MLPDIAEMSGASAVLVSGNRPRAKGVEARSGAVIKLLSTSILRGYNVYDSASVIRQEVDLGGFADFPSGQMGLDFATKFIDRFGGLKRRPSERGLPNTILDRLKSPEGLPMAEVLFQAILSVDHSMAFVMGRLGAIDYSEIKTAPTPERAFLVWRYRIPGVSRLAAEVGFIGFNELLPDELRQQAGVVDGGFDAAYRSLRTYARRWRISNLNTSITLRAAEKRGIPWELIEGQLARLGQGKFQRHVKNSATDRTSSNAKSIAQDKRVTSRLLADLRIPVPLQANPATIVEALSAAENIGYPVVVKPLDGNTGKGVCAGLKGPDAIPAAFERASEFGSGVIVESFIEGQDHRLIVIAGRLVAASKRVPPFVTGDGRRTIRGLTEDLNGDPRRDGFTLKKVTLDGELYRLLDLAGYTLDSVLAKDEIFDLRSMANYHAGGTPTDVTDHVHPDNRDMAIRAARAVRLDVAGIDLLISDISRSYKEVGGAIIEVNYRPGLDLHTFPSEGQSRDAAGAVIETMYPPGDQGRVPIALVAGAHGNGAVAGVLDRILRSAGMSVGLVTNIGAFVDGEPAGPEGARARQATQSLLRDPRVEALVYAVSPRQVAKRGLLHNYCEVAAIIESPNDATNEETRPGLDVVVKATRGLLVVGAENTLGLEAAGGTDPHRLVLVSRNADDSAIRRHLNVGGQAVVTALDQVDRVIVFMEGKRTVASCSVAAIPPLATNHSSQLLEAHLFAAALARGMGLSVEEIVSSLQYGNCASR